MSRSAPTAEPPAAPKEQRDYCPRCGAAYEPLQEYCLECGERLPVNRGLVGVLASNWQRRFAWYPGDWIWPTLLLALVAACAAALAIAFGGGSGSSTVIDAAPHNVTVGPGAPRETVPANVNTGTLPTAPEPTVPETTTAQTSPKTRANPNALADWPAGKSGYTVVLESIPTSSDRAIAVARARGAKRAGLPQVGVLTSAKYSSLHPGYYVVFSGVYASSADAAAAVSNARAKGFADAYQTRVTR
jgi:hypothetical protein